MFERFTDRARRVVVAAQEEARGLNHSYIGTEHLLLGLVGEDGVAARALSALGISAAAVREKVGSAVPKGERAPTGHIPFTPPAKRALELALRESLDLSAGYIGTEHILLGVLREREGAGARVLSDLGADLDSARQRVIEAVSAHAARRSGPRPSPAAADPLRALALEVRELRQEVERLRGILSEHGIEPGGTEPGGTAPG
jgi:ATP-dependent Clp protease ATP-binding subunit ClpC